MSNDIAIKVENLSKTYKLYDRPIDRLKESIHPLKKKYHKDFYALNDISFEIKKGETVGIIGKNGSGKSTLLKIITGVLSPTTGNVQVNGKVSALLELGTGFNPEYTGIENIYLNGMMMGFTREEIDKKLDSIIEFADIGDFVYQPVKMYSSGMFARLAFAVAINVEPEILIVDEALSVGDIKFQAKCFKKFRELKEQNITILFVSHDIFSIRNFCNEVIWFNNGLMINKGDTLKITAKYMEDINNEEKDLVYQHQNERVDKSAELIETLFNPINRWGMNQGLIKFVDIYNNVNKIKNEFEIGEKITIKIGFDVPKELDNESLSVAFSIKNKAGLDLIVSTTFDYEEIRIEKDGYVQVSFELANYLSVGEYILVAALENRENGTLQYYDYIEGAKYFKVFCNKKLFGLFNVPIIQKIEYKEM